MTFSREFLAFSTCTAMIMLLHCNAGFRLLWAAERQKVRTLTLVLRLSQLRVNIIPLDVLAFQKNQDPLPPPTNLSYQWLDPFTVEVSWSWEQPRNLPKTCDIKYVTDKQEKRCGEKHFTYRFLTEELGSDKCTYTIQTVGIGSCEDWTSSTSANITVYSKKPRAKLVDDFKCVLDPSGMNCSWIPVNQSLDLTLSYRMEGITVRNSSKYCQYFNISGQRTYCHLDIFDGAFDVWINLDSEIGQSTFNALIVVPSPKLTIREDKHRLNLTWEALNMKSQCWIYKFNYTQCGKSKQLEVLSNFLSIPYDENCLYEFRSKVVNKEVCLSRISDWSEVVTYGTNRPHDGTLTVVAIVIPIILFVCVLLSCYCFRKHSNILCPIIPDPSAIFKEMMMNGNKELKTSGSLYTPVPEPVEHCKVTLVTENSDPQQDS